MELFRKSKGHDVGQLRFYNTLGFSPDRLESLLYDLKKVHNVTDLQVAKSKRKSPLAPKGGTLKVVKDDAASSEEKTEDKKEDIQGKASEENSEDKKDDTPSSEDKKEGDIQGEASEVIPDVTDEDLSASLEVTKDDAAAVDKKEEGPSEEFKKKLADFDLETEKYNSIKSFAADVSDVTGEDPADQKSATLKAFVADAKKKYSQS